MQPNNDLIKTLKKDLVRFNQDVLTYDEMPWFSRNFFTKLGLFLFDNIEKRRELVCYDLMMNADSSKILAHINCE